MARYRLKRKTFGVGDAVQNTIGGVTEGVGKAMDTKVGGAAGALVGGSLLSGALTTGMLANTSVATTLGSLAGPAGLLIGAGLGAAAARGIGKGLKTAGQDMQT